jgi:SWI/SNF-related matrix-associated actin-dependent regulator of chromatin subfamily A member 5
VFPRLTILLSHRTPIQNDLLETWSLLHWLYPEVFTKSTSDLFKDAFALGEGKVDPIFVQHVRRFLEVIMLRRVKDSPGIGLDLPAKTAITLYAPLTRLQRLLYRQVLMGVQDDSPSQPSTPSKSAVMQDARHKQLGSALGGNEAGNNNFLITTTEFNGRNPRTVRNVLMELRKVSSDQHFTG